MNIWDILIIVLVASAVLLAVIRVRKGKSRCCERGCGCGCENCGKKTNKS